MPIRTQKIDPRYAARVERLAQLHPAASEFLVWLERDGNAHDLWLSTATNAHVYKGEAFLIYVKLNDVAKRANSISLSPRFNNQIADGTSDRSTLVFRKPLEKLVSQHSGFKDKWARLHADGEIELTTQAPAAFFDSLKALLCDLKIEGLEPQTGS